MRIGVDDLTLLSESGLYKLIMRSDKPHRPPLPRLGNHGGPPGDPEGQFSSHKWVEFASKTCHLGKLAHE